MSVHDPQQARVYRVGSQLRRARGECMSQAEVLDFVRYATSRPWWLARSDAVPIRVVFTEDEHASATSEWATGVITLPDWALNRSTITHELTHQLFSRYHPEQDFELQPHGPVFAATWLELVRQTVPNMYLQMCEAFRREGVVFDASKETPSNDRRGIALRLSLPCGNVACASTAYTLEALSHSLVPDARGYMIEKLRDALERPYRASTLR